jgi:hypothetical protein
MVSRGEACSARSNIVEMQFATLKMPLELRLSR